MAEVSTSSCRVVRLVSPSGSAESSSMVGYEKVSVMRRKVVIAIAFNVKEDKFDIVFVLSSIRAR